MEFNKMKYILKRVFLGSVPIHSIMILGLSGLLMLSSGTSQAGYVRTYKMFDVSQTADPTWGDYWCAPTAVGNSLAWIAKEYNLPGLVKVNGTGDPLSAKDVVNILGKVDMGTDPDSGTERSKILDGKLSYIERHGLKDVIRVESQVAIPKRAADGSFAGWDGTRVTKQWLKDQYDKGQDVEFAVSRYERIGDKWYRRSGHVEVKDGGIPGSGAGGHLFSLAGYSDASGSDSDSDFLVSFTDPGRNDLAGEYGALSADQYYLSDFWGNVFFNTASTYQVNFDPDPFGIGVGALLLDGYQGIGDFANDGANRRFLTVLEAGWAESVPEPGTFALILISGVAMFISCRRGRNGVVDRNRECIVKCMA